MGYCLPNGEWAGENGAMNDIENFWKSIPTWGKVAMGLVVVGIILFIWAPWKSSGSSGETSTVVPNGTTPNGTSEYGMPITGTINGSSPSAISTTSIVNAVTKAIKSAMASQQTASQASQQTASQASSQTASQASSQTASQASSQTASSQTASQQTASQQTASQQTASQQTAKLSSIKVQRSMPKISTSSGGQIDNYAYPVSNSGNTSTYKASNGQTVQVQNVAADGTAVTKVPQFMIDQFAAIQAKQASQSPSNSAAAAAAYAKQAMAPVENLPASGYKKTSYGGFSYNNTLYRQEGNSLVSLKTGQVVATK